MNSLKTYKSFFIWILLIAVFLILWGILPLPEWFQIFSRFMQSLGIWGVVGFSFVYVVGTTFLVPGSVMTVAAGVAYGFWGIPLVLVASSIGSIVPFFIARFFFREKVVAFFKKKPKFDKYAKALETEGLVAITLLRFSPLIPFNLQNYFFGTIHMELWKFSLTTFLAMLPGTLFYIYLGMFGLSDESSLLIIITYFSLEVVSTIVGGWMMRKYVEKDEVVKR